jgi:hypothetical protein
MCFSRSKRDRIENEEKLPSFRREDDLAWHSLTFKVRAERSPNVGASARDRVTARMWPPFARTGATRAPSGIRRTRKRALPFVGA